MAVIYQLKTSSIFYWILIIASSMHSLDTITENIPLRYFDGSILFCMEMYVSARAEQGV